MRKRKRHRKCVERIELLEAELRMRGGTFVNWECTHTWQEHQLVYALSPRYRDLAL